MYSTLIYIYFRTSDCCCFLACFIFIAVPFIEVMTCFLFSSLSRFSSSSSTGSTPSLFLSVSSTRSFCCRKKSSYVNLTQWTESHNSKPHCKHAGSRISVTPERFVLIIRRTERPLTNPLILLVRIPPSRLVFNRNFSNSTNLEQNCRLVKISQNSNLANT